MNISQDENLDNSAHLKQQYDSEYKRGLEEGISTAGNRCYESGFRDGVQFGVEMGFYKGYFQIIKNYLKKSPQDFKVTNRILQILEKNEDIISSDSDLEKIKGVYKLVQSSLKVLKKLNASSKTEEKI